MATVAISYFKAHCLEIIEQLQASKETIIITKREKPVAKITSFSEAKQPSIFGLFKGKFEITGDIVESSGEKWDAEND